MYKKFISWILCFSVLLSLFTIVPVRAAYDNAYEGTMAGDGNGIYAHGVDLSEWQGHQVDFHKIKEQGYSFVILRAGFATTIDDCFEENYAKAKEAGLDVGVYLYSYADNTEEAREEAGAMLRWLQDKQLEYPVYYDLEDPKCHGNMSVELLTEIAFTFLEILSEEGWLVGFYSCKSWLENKFDTAAIGATYECWMAQFVSSGTYDIYDRYDEVYGMWQYSCTGTVDGVPGGVDMNVCFKDYPGICRQYGFNGYRASDESLVLNDASVPSLLLRGERMELSGKLISYSGELTNVTVGIYSPEGQILTGRSLRPGSSKFDLADISSGIRTHELAEGTYFFRISATNSEETRMLLNQQLIISDTGVFLQEISIPKDLKQGRRYQLSGTVFCESAMKTLTVTVKDASGNTSLQFRAEPGSDYYDLSELQVDLSGLAIGEYKIMLEILTDHALYRALDEKFNVWSAYDPVTLERLQLQSEYLAGEPNDFEGIITSTFSDLRQVDFEILDQDGTVIIRVMSQPGKKQVSLADYAQRMRIESLPIGVYRLRISVLNDAGPKELLDKRFLIREDGVGLCNPVAPSILYERDSFSLGGVVFSDISMLTYVGVSVSDSQGREVLSTGAVPNRELFDLSLLNDRLCFSELPCGAYSLRIFAENENVGSLLYDATFYVVDHSDLISWEEPCMDPRGIAYSAASGYYLNGVLTSAESPITSATAEILLRDGQVIASVELPGEGYSISLEKCNEKLRFSALPEGEYILRITASNASGCYEMLRSQFSVTNCVHSSVQSGKVLSSGCETSGLVTDSRCMDCGSKVRNGFGIAPQGHQESEGVCNRCGKKSFVTVSAQVYTDTPTVSSRYVIACCSDGIWYALAFDGSTVRIPAPNEDGIAELSAAFLWQIEPVAEGYVLRNPFGKLLHLDRGQLSVGVGYQNAVLMLEHVDGNVSFSLVGYGERCLTFSEELILVGEKSSEFVLLQLVSLK